MPWGGGGAWGEIFVAKRERERKTEKAKSCNGAVYSIIFLCHRAANFRVNPFPLRNRKWRENVPGSWLNLRKKYPDPVLTHAKKCQTRT